jgi:hypothetical protein
MAFHNPYHFVPVKNGGRLNDLPREEFEHGQSSTRKHVTHDRYIEGAKSGRIICRLTTEEPLVIGAEQGKTAPAKVEPFKLDEKPAIPASTLRGLISGIVEAASNSALRVLENEKYSYRKHFEQPPLGTKPPEWNENSILSAIGMIVEENGRLRLRPLTLPTLRGRRGNISLDQKFRVLYQKPNLKVYIGNEESIRQDTFPYKTFRKGGEKYYYLQIKNREWNEQYQLPDDDNQYWRNDQFLLGQTPLDNNFSPLTEEEVPSHESDQHIRGIVRVLGCYSRDLPNTKKHELFIPYPVEAESWPTFEIPDGVQERFKMLSDLRTEEVKKEIAKQIKEATDKGASAHEVAAIKRHLLPYEPFDTIRNPNPENENDFSFRLKDGDLVYFRPEFDARTHQPVIAEVSLSAIWRGRVEIKENNQLKAASAHMFFEKVDAELLPFNPKRKVVTLAEQIFGFVEEIKKIANQPRSRWQGAFIHLPQELRASGRTVRKIPAGCQIIADWIRHLNR